MHRYRKALAILAGLAVFGFLAAAAATLGGITSPELGADATVVASCDTDGVSAAYTTSYSTTVGGYVVTGVTIGGIDTACNGMTVSITLAGNVAIAGSQTAPVVGSGSATASAGSAAITLATPADAEAVEHLAVVIA